MSLLSRFLSRFNHTEETLSKVSQEIITHVEDEFKALEARISAIEQHLIGGASISVPPTVSIPAPANDATMPMPPAA